MIPKIVISKCLGFEKCRYNGQTIPDRFVEKICDFAEVITVCPEVEIGLGIPRKPVRLGRREDKIHMIQPATDQDVTDKMANFTTKFLSKIKNIDGFIMKNRSPSCGINDVKIYHNLEKLSAANRGKGFFGGQLADYFPHAAIEDEGRLKNLQIREHFLTKLYTNMRFRHAKNKQQMNALVQFHTEHKYLFMAYNQAIYRKAGKIVANHEKHPLQSVLNNYEEKLTALLAKAPKPGANINALQHLFGGISDQLTKEERKFFIDTVEEYRDERIPLNTVIHLIKSYAIRFDNQFILDQYFMKPFPEELVTLSDSGKKNR